MPQLSLYLDDTSMANLRDAAGRNGVSLSKYVSEVLHRQQDTSCLWARGFFDLYGSCNETDLSEPCDAPIDPQAISALDAE